MDKVEPVFPRAKCTYASVRNARALMIEMRTKNGFSDFERNLKVVKKFMKLNKLHEKKLIYDELLLVYEPSSQVQSKTDKGWEVIESTEATLKIKPPAKKGVEFRGHNQKGPNQQALLGGVPKQQAQAPK